MGFLLTSISIRLCASLASAYGWRWAALSMAAGPVVGIVAMGQLSPNPAALVSPDDAVAEITSP